ncbi:hypothetical protein HYS94_00315 [Candidatus Daviesbacteria bacterium]|nr:hypothetical protein [Candidatus Daviesbacteria bacterium]
MKQFSQRRFRIEKVGVTYISRNLKGKGNLTVHLGQEVTPSEIIGTFELSFGFRILNLANLLSVQGPEVKKYLQKGMGQRIYKGELLAFKKDLFGNQKVVTAPSDGVIDYLNERTGGLKISAIPKKVDLPAAVFGVVDAINQQLGQVIIRTEVSKVYGVFGTGRSRDGILHFLGRREDIITANKISPAFSDNILVGGSILYKDAISEAISSSISGFITGGMNARDYMVVGGGRLVFPKKIENDIGISIVGCEGFGLIPIGEDIYNYLLNYDGKFGIIDGNTATLILPSFSSQSMSLVKRTKLPPPSQMVPANQTLIPQHDLSVGQKVRVVGISFLGEQGKIIVINQSETLLPSGIKGYILTIETKRRKIQIPSNNVEIID